MFVRTVYVRGLTCRVAVQLSSLDLTLVHWRAIRGIAGDEGSVTITFQLTVLQVPLLTRLEGGREGRRRDGGRDNSSSVVGCRLVTYTSHTQSPSPDTQHTHLVVLSVGAFAATGVLFDTLPGAEDVTRVTHTAL